jgi:DNA-binding transcriptional regulator WhiA
MHDAHVTKRGTVRFGQNEPEWHNLVRNLLLRLGHNAWTYKEGKHREFWITETSAKWLTDQIQIHSATEVEAYARGYFDTEGTVPKPKASRLYIQFVQKNLADIDALRSMIESIGIKCGKMHNPSRTVDPDMWRFYIRASSHRDFLERIGSWHPRKKILIEGWKARKQDEDIVRASWRHGDNVNKVAVADAAAGSPPF